MARRLVGGTPWLAIVHDIVAALPADVYISFDVDGMDPAFCPHTGTPVPGGLHFHVLHLGGVFVRDGHGRLTFRSATPSTEDVERLVVRIAQACEAWLSKQGFGKEDEAEPLDEDDAQVVLQQASLGGCQAVGPRAGKAVRKVQVLGGREVKLPPRCSGFDGYNLHVVVDVKESDRDGLGRRRRFVARSPGAHLYMYAR